LAALLVRLEGPASARRQPVSRLRHTSPTWTRCVVERWLAAVKRRKDFLGCVDVIACRRGEPVLGVQATSASNVSARVKKAVATPGLHVWLATGHAVFNR
jgi:hypothetical protein